MRTHDRDNEQVLGLLYSSIRTSQGVNLVKDIRDGRLHPPRRARPAMQQEHDHDTGVDLRPPPSLRVRKDVHGQARDNDGLLVWLLRVSLPPSLRPAAAAF